MQQARKEWSKLVNAMHSLTWFSRIIAPIISTIWKCFHGDLFQDQLWKSLIEYSSDVRSFSTFRPSKYYFGGEIACKIHKMPTFSVSSVGHGLNSKHRKRLDTKFWLYSSQSQSDLPFELSSNKMKYFYLRLVLL